MSSDPKRRFENPGPFQLPQHTSEDRQRARQLTVGLCRARYPRAQDPGLPNEPDVRLPACTAPWPGSSRFRKAMTRLVGSLPPKEVFISELPPEARFKPAKFFRHATHAGSMKLRLAYVKLTNFDFRPRSARAYERLLGTIPPPRVKEVWESDEVFARQRIAGVNPMAIRRCGDTPAEPVARAADKVLETRYGTSFNKACDAGRLYVMEYPQLWEQPVQEHVRRGSSLAAPTCLFYVDDHQKLQPLAIRLKPNDVTDANPVLTPLHAAVDWMLARAHAQAADSHYHEAISHLMETHLVSEVCALATFRNLHPDHPLHQLMTPHFEHTLAINEQARKNLLADHGEIARCMAAKHVGNVNLVRLTWRNWTYDDHNLHTDIRRRDVGDLPGYLYRDDATAVWKAMDAYVRGILGIWYTTDEDVRQDRELQAWAAEIGDVINGGVRGFPTAFNTREELFGTVTNVVFRASAQHAAVNNGQFGAYGWVPNAPVAVFAPLPDREPSHDDRDRPLSDYYRAMPNRARTFGQTGMVWLLSEPTERSLFRAGQQPAFSREGCYQAYEVVGRFRRKLKTISDAIDVRNDEVGFEYNYLKPQNIDNSIAI